LLRSAAQQRSTFGAVRGRRRSAESLDSYSQTLMKNIPQRIDALIETGRQLQADWEQTSVPEDAALARASASSRWVQSAEHVLEFTGLLSHRERFRAIHGSNARQPYKYAQLVGILESAKDEIAAGFLGRVAYLAHADLFGSVTEQAEELLASGHVIPAAVLGRIVIESWLRDEAERNQIPDHDTAKASVLNECPKSGGIFAIPKWRLIQGYLDIGNAAAHGKDGDFNPADVRQLLSFARSTAV
jgi:hypothetical protein